MRNFNEGVKSATDRPPQSSNAKEFATSEAIPTYLSQRLRSHAKASMRFHSITLTSFTLCLGLVVAGNADAQNVQASTGPGPRVTIVNKTLNTPFSLTVEARTNRVIVAESGAMRIVEIKDGEVIELAGDFPESQFHGYPVGPIAVTSAGESAMLVSHRSPAGKGALTRLLRNNAQDEDEVPDFDRQTVEIESMEDWELGPLSQVMLKNSLVYAVTGGDPATGWIAIAGIQHKKLMPLSPLIPTSRHTGCESPSSIAVSPDGAYLVVSQMGQRDDRADSQLAFYSLGGKLLAQYQVELNDVIAIAYSPNRKHLFAIDHHFSNPQRGGLYKIIGVEPVAGNVSGSNERCRVKKIADLSYPSAMAFDDSGTLWVTTLGAPARDAATDAGPAGTLVKIEGLDDPFKVDQDFAMPLESVLPRTQP